MKKRPDESWEDVIAKLNATKSGKLTITMGSPGSAQVTRCRLLREWANLEATTVGADLILSLKGA